MGRSKDYLRQHWRVAAFLINALLFYGLYVAVSGKWSITGGGEALWFISALAWWGLGLLSAPWYRPPRDAIGASVGALIALFTLDLSTALTLGPLLYTARAIAIGYALVVMAAAVTAAFVPFGGRQERVRQVAFSIADRLAAGEVLFGSAALISIFGYYTEPATVFLLTAVWLTFALLRPVEFAIQLLVRAWAAAARREDTPPVGIVQRVDHPDIVRVTLTASQPWQEERIHIACLAGERVCYVIPLFTQTQDNEIVGTGFCVGNASEDITGPETGAVYASSRTDVLPDLMRALSGSNDEAEIVGFVVEGSTIGAIEFEASRDRGLQEAFVVFCNLAVGRVYYQILDALTKEESFRHNPKGTHVVHAVQLGTYSEKEGFKKYPWLPPMNAPVFRLMNPIQAATPLSDGEFVVGTVPSTNIGLRVSLPQLVEYHTAILGVTGTGKTELALDVVREALKQKTKVFCVDLTGEYAKRLEANAPKPMGLTLPEADDLEQKLFDAETGQYGGGAEKKVLKGFLDGLRSQVKDRINTFLSSEDDWLAVFELAEVTNTRATLRTTELFLSEIMLWARRNRKARRIMIVLEEAHTIIPETAGSGLDYDSQWVVSRIGQIALQGRKYGVGLLIVSQRTALVSKTILSQCNTYFTHALVDQTSLGYLANIYSNDHVRAIPNLRFLEFLAFGRGVRSERPMLVRREFDDAKFQASKALDRVMPPS